MKNLTTEEFQCKLITPMFLGGSKPTKHSELRPPSIRGGMRWWLRAMMGGVIGNNIVKLQTAEEFVFGSSNKCSSIIVKTIGNPKTSEYPRLPHKAPGNDARRPALTPNDNFKISLTLAATVRESEELIFNCAKYSLLLMLCLGGLGTRSRRGFGDVQLSTDSDIVNVIENAHKFFLELKTKLSINFSGWDAFPLFPCLTREYFKLTVSKEYSNWSEALTDLMNKMHTFDKTSPSRNAIGGVNKNKRQASPLIVHAKENLNEKGDKIINLYFSHFFTEQSAPYRIAKTDVEALEKFIKEEFSAKEMEVFK